MHENDKRGDEERRLLRFVAKTVQAFLQSPNCALIFSFNLLAQCNTVALFMSFAGKISSQQGFGRPGYTSGSQSFKLYLSQSHKDGGKIGFISLETLRHSPPRLDRGRQEARRSRPQDRPGTPANVYKEKKLAIVTLVLLVFY